MSELGDVLEAMNAAPRGFEVLLGEISAWRDLYARGHGGPSEGAEITGDPIDAEVPEHHEIRLWMATDGRFRIQRQWGEEVFDGVHLWMQKDDVVSQLAPHGDPSGVLGESGFLVSPREASAAAKLEVSGHTRVAGHPAVVVEGALRGDHHRFPTAFVVRRANRLRLAVDVRTGVILRAEGWLDARLLMRLEFEALEYDAPLVHDPFVFEAADHLVVHTIEEMQRERRRRHANEEPRLAPDIERSVSTARTTWVAPPSLLADRFMPLGSPPEDADAARVAVTHAVVHMNELDDTGGLPNVQGGSNLGPSVEAAAAQVHIEEQAAFEVDDILFVRADEAVVAFRVLVPKMAGGFSQTGRVIKVGDRWKVERATMCNLLGMAGVACPPPPDGP
jgi:hypothetical protein